jgi:hypothetical protein
MPTALNSAKTFSGTHFCWRLSQTQGLVWLEGVVKFKNQPHRDMYVKALIDVLAPV